jgi:hypothetical protein
MSYDLYFSWMVSHAVEESYPCVQMVSSSAVETLLELSLFRHSVDRVLYLALQLIDLHPCFSLGKVA